MGNGELPGLASGHETVGDAVVISAEHDGVVGCGEGHLVVTVADLFPFEIPDRVGLVDTLADHFEIVLSAVLVTADQHH